MGGSCLCIELAVRVVVLVVVAGFAYEGRLGRGSSLEHNQEFVPAEVSAAALDQVPCLMERIESRFTGARNCEDVDGGDVERLRLWQEPWVPLDGSPIDHGTRTLIYLFS